MRPESTKSPREGVMPILQAKRGDNQGRDKVRKGRTAQSPLAEGGKSSDFCNREEEIRRNPPQSLEKRKGKGHPPMERRETD